MTFISTLGLGWGQTENCTRKDTIISIVGSMYNHIFHESGSRVPSRPHPLMQIHMTHMNKTIIIMTADRDNAERTREVLRDFQETSSIVKLATVAGSTEDCHQL